MRVAPGHRMVSAGPVAQGRQETARDWDRDGYGKTAPELRRTVEHQLRLFRHPDRLCAAKREHEPDLPDARREHGRSARAVDRRPAYRSDRPADRRPSVRPDMESA